MTQRGYMMPGSVLGATPYGALHLICTFLCVLTANSERTNYISTVGRGVVSAEDGNAFFRCHRSEPDENATVETGRYVYTLNYLNNNPDPPDPTESIQGNPSSVVYTSNLPGGYDAYGVFYCASRYDGGWTVVPMVFLRSNAKFQPAGGRFAKTVNTMDTGVTVDFNRINPEDRESNWRHNGTAYPEDVLAINYNSSLTIPHDVQPSDGGVYELTYGNQRGQARGGLMRLIVRECRAGRHNTSAQCLLVCPSCYNGGICDDKTGLCICPPGFMGENCEIACGRNRYGTNCEYRCDYSTSDLADACQGLQVCVPDPYGCSCTPGFKGLDCETGCDTGEFGASCTETCHCESGDCNQFTGICTGTPTTCMSGWEGVNCQGCVQGKYGRNCTGNILTTYTKTNEGIPPQVYCMFEGEQLYSTADPVVRLYRKCGTEEFNEDGIVLVDSSYTYNISRTQVGEIFYCSMSDVNTYNSAENIGDGTYALIQLQSPPSMAGTTNETVMLTWPAWNANTGIGDPPLVGYDVFFKVDTPSSEHEQVLPRSLEPTRTITGLSPDTDYVFGVRAVRPGEGGEGRILDVSGSTSCSPPEGPSSVAVMNSTTPGQISLSIQIPDEGSNCREGYTGVRIYHPKLDDTSSIQKRAAPPFTDFPLVCTGRYDVASLEPSSRYAISVALLNRGSESVISSKYIAMTAEINTTGASKSCFQYHTLMIPWALFGISLSANFICGFVFAMHYFRLGCWRKDVATSRDGQLSGKNKEPSQETSTSMHTYEGLRKAPHVSTAPLTDASVDYANGNEGTYENAAETTSSEDAPHIYQGINQPPVKKGETYDLEYETPFC